MAANLAKHHLGKAAELDAQEAAMDAKEAAIAKEAASKPPLSRPLASLLGKAIVVTGATSGLGRCIALQCAKAGARGVLVLGRDAKRGAAVVAAIKDAAPQCLCEFVRRRPRGEGPACAAAALAAATKLFGTVEGLAFAAHMKASKTRGSVVNIGSCAAHGGAPFILAYSCSKGGLTVLTKNSAQELRGDGIRVNQINMGWCLTDAEDAGQRAEKGDGWLADDAGSPSGRLLRTVDPSAKRQSNQPSITTHRRTPSLTPAELAAQAKRAEAARLSAAAAVRALAEKRRPASSSPPPAPRGRARVRRAAPEATAAAAALAAEDALRRARADPAARAAGARTPEATAAAAALAAKGRAARGARRAEETRPLAAIAEEARPPAPAVRVSGWVERFMDRPPREARAPAAPAFEMPAKMNDFILEGFRDRQAGSRAPPDESSSSDDDEDESRSLGSESRGDDASRASGPRPEDAARRPPRPKRDRYYEEASDDDAAPPEAEVLEKPARHRDRDRIRRHKLRKVGASDLDQIRARGAATVLSARLAATSDTVGTTITQLKQRIATKSVESIETDLARLRREIATRDPGWQRQDDEPTDVSYELDQAAAALELFETHVARAERALATVGPRFLPVGDHRRVP
ncbi:short chain dehydrogenase [Aureococcus anophagefferens]|uniref:Short chain dehydrogenase n=1 Tax=Aureococcus anophagefferens TaxID=44056 RepID=A0ABR1FHY9_AURAN